MSCYSLITKLRMVAVLPVALILLCATASNADLSSLNDLSDLAKLEKMCVNAPPTSEYRSPEKQIRQEFALIKKGLSGTTVADRPAKLSELAKNTKWGTPERAAAYYVCAWYGVDYQSSRDYLLNSVLWLDRGYYKSSNLHPYAWIDMGPVLLYKLYEHNLDFHLLHDLMLGREDAAVAEALTACKIDAFWKHPRGVLHMAEISPEGHEYVVHALRKRTGDPNLDCWFDDDKERGSVFADYVSRVAADTKDPLQPLAKGLLRDAKRMK